MYYRELQFLQNVVAIRDADVEGQSTEGCRNEEEAKTGDTKNNLEKRRRKTERFRAKQQKIQRDTYPLPGVLNTCTEEREQRERSEDDEDRMFLLSLLSSLKSVPQGKKMTLKINIMSLINEAMRESA
jgi:hypothetical protein